VHAPATAEEHEESSTEEHEESSTNLITHYLDEHHVPYKVFEHDRSLSAAGEARATGVAPHNAAKSVLLRDRRGYRLAVIPASERLALKKLRGLIDAGQDLRFATEREMADDFPTLEIGALPPLGALLSVPEAIDERLLEHPRILCNAGDHRHSMLLDPRDLADLADTRIGDICEG
jgi:Ala-tRNA(Pro) deacylase